MAFKNGSFSTKFLYSFEMGKSKFYDTLLKGYHNLLEGYHTVIFGNNLKVKIQKQLIGLALWRKNSHCYMKNKKGVFEDAK